MNDSKILTRQPAVIVNKVFKTAVKMFAIRFWRKNAVGTEVSKFDSHIKHGN